MQISNSEIIQELIEKYIGVVGKNTSHEFAVSTIDYAINKLKETYSFLGYIKINKTQGLDIKEIVEVDPAIDVINLSRLKKPVEDIFLIIVRTIYESERFFYVDIRKIRDTLTEDCRLALDILNADLKFDWSLKGAGRDLKGKSTEFDKHVLKNSEVLEPVVNVLIKLLLREIKEEKDALMIIFDAIKKIEKNHDLFDYLIVGKKRNERNIFPVRIMFSVKDIIFLGVSDQYSIIATSKLDETLSEKTAKAIQDLIGEVGKSINIEIRHMFVEDFITELGQIHLAKIEEIGVKLDELDGSLQQESYGLLARKVLGTLIDIMASKTSVNFAMVAIDTMLDELRPIHDNVLKYVSTDKNRYDEGKAAIIIDSELDYIDSEILARALKGIIRKIQKNRDTEEEKRVFMDEFKEQLGKRHTAELESIGINLFMIGLKFI